MSSRVLLISLNRCSSPDPVFPLGLVYLNAALRSARHKTRWLDCQTDSDSLAPVMASFQPDVVGISLRNIDDILMGRKETFFDDLPALCQQVRSAADCPIVLGGSGFSIFPQRLLDLSHADFGICGCGERSFVALLHAFEHHTDPDAIPGLVYRRASGTCVNLAETCLPEAELEAQDWPERLVEHYLRTSGMLSVQTQRGCALKCSYCTYPVIEGRIPHARPPEMVADDLQTLEKLGARYAFIVDSVFNTSSAHVKAICETILQRGLRIRWSCFLRPCGITRKTMQLMKRAGLAHIEFGSDSFSDSVLQAYGKSFTFEDILQASLLARQENIEYCHFLICGGPGETAETLQSSFANADRLPSGVILAVAGMRIYPGTPLHARAVAEGQANSGADYSSHLLPCSGMDERKPFCVASWPGSPAAELDRGRTERGNDPARPKTQATRRARPALEFLFKPAASLAGRSDWCRAVASPPNRLAALKQIFAHVLDAGAHQKLAGLIGWNIVNDRDRHGLAKIKPAIGGPEILVDAAVKLDGRAVHDDRELVLLHSYQPHFRDSS